MRHSVTFRLIITVCVSLVLCACDDQKNDTPASDNQPAAKEHAHAPPGAEPGSHEDWCGEHQVPESQCTRCNPSLVAAFKATGDWCQEHQLPESQCLICNPELKIERPPKGK